MVPAGARLRHVPTALIAVLLMSAQLATASAQADSRSPPFVEALWSSERSAWFIVVGGDPLGFGELDHSPDCGGFAPLLTNCTTGMHTRFGWYLAHGFLVRPCGSSISPVYVQGACYVGNFESRLSSPDGTVWQTVRCEIVTLLDRRPDFTCTLDGVPQGDVFRHSCEARQYYPSSFPQLQVPSEGGIGEWACFIFHT